jgi:hypothetical protein
MGRTIISGSSVWVSAADHPRWGEIWAFCESASTVKVHRYVARRGGRNRFWGDGNRGADDLVDDALLIGRVAGVEGPDGTYRSMSPRRQVIDACYVGAVRVPRRLASRAWYGARALARRGSSRPHT